MLSHFRRKAPIVVLAAVALTGCAVTPKPLQTDELRAITQADWQKAQAEVPPLSAPLSLPEAIARALKYNLEHRAHQLEEAHAGGRHAVRRVLQVKEGGRRQRKLRRTAPQLRQNCARIARACSRSGFLRRLASKADAQ